VLGYLVCCLSQQQVAILLRNAGISEPLPEGVAQIMDPHRWQANASRQA
jgi:hypothetical protein